MNIDRGQSPYKGRTELLRLALLGATMLMGAGALTAANAADLYPQGDSLKDEPGYMPGITWTGFYVGAHVGGSFDDGFDFTQASNNGTDVEVLPIGNTTLVGLHLGYNWQAANNIVLGVEGDYTFTGSDALEGSLGTDSIASVRARLGYAYGKTLIYATGGVAFLNWSDTFKQSVFGELGLDDSVVSWVAGAGLEHKITSNVSIGLEGLYYAFDDSATVSGIDTPDVTNSYERDFWAVRARLNYHFNHGYDEPLK